MPAFKAGVLAMLFMLTTAWAQAGSLLPKVPKAKAKATEEHRCVEPLPEMRRNHMKKILDQRVKTVRKGIRTKQHSLAQCINCHVKAKPDGSFPRYGNKDHFCSSCHRFVGVTIDCFECHRDTPDPGAKPYRADHASSAARVNPMVSSVDDDRLSSTGKDGEHD